MSNRAFATLVIAALATLLSFAFWLAFSARKDVRAAQRADQECLAKGWHRYDATMESCAKTVWEDLHAK